MSDKFESEVEAMRSKLETNLREQKLIDQVFSRMVDGGASISHAGDIATRGDSDKASFTKMLSHYDLSDLEISRQASLYAEYQSELSRVKPGSFKVRQLRREYRKKGLLL